MLIDELMKRKSFLEAVIARTSKNLPDEFPGYIRAARQHGKVRYYYVDAAGNQSYLRAGQTDLAKRVLQQTYDERIYKRAVSELRLINKLLKMERPDVFVKEYERLGEYRMPLVNAYKISDEAYAKNWLAEPYQGRVAKPGEAMHYSGKGELMHSKAEVIVADICLSLGIPYKYEYPHKIWVPDALALQSQGSYENSRAYRQTAGRGAYQTWYPDFTLLNKTTREEIIVEYFGLISSHCKWLACKL